MWKLKKKDTISSQDSDPERIYRLIDYSASVYLLVSSLFLFWISQGCASLQGVILHDHFIQPLCLTDEETRVLRMWTLSSSFSSSRSGWEFRLPDLPSIFPPLSHLVSCQTLRPDRKYNNYCYAMTTISQFFDLLIFCPSLGFFGINLQM